MKKVNGGFLIAIEGIDGAGKSSQVLKLKERFNAMGFNAINLKEPSDSEFTKQIRFLASTDHPDFHNPEKLNNLFTEDRKLDVKNNIQPNLEEGNIIIMDRYFLSNIAYQAAQGMDMEKLKEQNEAIAPIPDIAIILDIAPDGGIHRIVHKRKDKTDSFEKEDYLAKVREKFNLMDYPYIIRLDGDGNKTIDEIHESIFEEVKKVFDKKLEQE